MTTTPLVVGLGDTLYRVERPFGTLPTGQRLADVSAVAVGTDGDIYVVQRTDPPVVVFAPDGRFVRSFGAGVLVDPHGVTAAPTGGIWVADRDAHELVRFTPAGDVATRVGRRHLPAPAGMFNHPAAVLEAQDGSLVVGDGYGDSHVHVLEADGRPRTRWGTPGGGRGEFATPHGIAVDHSGAIYVADRENDRVEIFTFDGTWTATIGGLYRPTDLAVLADGSVLVADHTPRLSRYVAGELVGRCKPVAVVAHGIDVAADGTIYLAEPAPHDRITRLVPR
ncbi:MAG: hypothetical protein WD377_07030 [Nitriliruptoraceae bacterium]